MNMFLVFKNWVATQSAQVILIFKRFGERDGDKKENEKTMKSHFYLIQGKKKKMLESIYTYRDYRSRNE